MFKRLFKYVGDLMGRLPGLPILVAVLLIVLNFVFQLLPAWPVVDWIAGTDLLLHLGLVLGFLGLLMGDAL